MTFLLNCLVSVLTGTSFGTAATMGIVCATIASTLGIRPWNPMRYVVLPQAIKNILPALGNEFVTIIKDSSLLQTIGVMELWNGAQTVATTTYLTLTPLLFAAFYYLIVTTAMTALLKQMEKRLGEGRK